MFQSTQASEPCFPAKEIKRLFPYGAQYSTSLGPKVEKVLKEMTGLPLEHPLILATTQHNGRGAQWGVVLLKVTDEQSLLLFTFAHGDNILQLLRAEWGLGRSLRKLRCSPVWSL